MFCDRFLYFLPPHRDASNFGVKHQVSRIFRANHCGRTLPTQPTGPQLSASDIYWAIIIFLPQGTFSPPSASMIAYRCGKIGPSVAFGTTPLAGRSKSDRVGHTNMAAEPYSLIGALEPDRKAGFSHEAAFIAELQAGNETAYARLIELYHRPIFSIIARNLQNPADAADTTQEVFIKVFRGIGRFHGESSLKTWIYRIALHEASNQRRWWFRHKAKDTSIEPQSVYGDTEESSSPCLRDTLAAPGRSPFEAAANAELRQQIEAALLQVSQPYRTSLILRDLEQMSYEEIAEITEVSLGTVKSRLTRGREMLRQRLAAIVGRADAKAAPVHRIRRTGEQGGARQVEVAP